MFSFFEQQFLCIHGTELGSKLSPYHHHHRHEHRTEAHRHKHAYELVLPDSPLHKLRDENGSVLVDRAQADYGQPDYDDDHHHQVPRNRCDYPQVCTLTFQF